MLKRRGKSVGSGAALREARSALGLSQSQLGRVWHCPSTTISRWERASLIEFGAVSGIIYRAIVRLSKSSEAQLIGCQIRTLNKRNELNEGDSAALPFVLNLYFKEIGAL